MDQVQSNEMYQMVTGVDPARLNEETELFRERGTFCGNLGDLVIRVCADMLQIPVVVITSLASFPYTSFVLWYLQKGERVTVSEVGRNSSNTWTMDAS